MVTKVRLFVSMKNEVVARSLGMRRLRRAPQRGQLFDIPVDGRDVHARITRCAAGTQPLAGLAIGSVYAEEV
jgi:hypothetical protein